MLEKLLRSALGSLKKRQQSATVGKRTATDTQGDVRLLQEARDLTRDGHVTKAIDAYQRYLASNDSDSDALAALGHLYLSARRLGDAVRCYEAALQLDPDNCELLMALGQLYFRCNCLTEAQECYEHILRQVPEHAGALNNLGMVYLESGDAARAVSLCRRALSSKPKNQTAYANLLFCANYLDTLSPEGIFREHINWSQLFFPTPPPLNVIPNRRPGPRVRIGYVSPNLKKHSVGFFFESLLEHHDKNNFEIFCYDSKNVPDEVTERFKGYAEHWRVIAGLSDDRAEAMLREDSLDILVDLAGHTSTNSLNLFARRIAPIQVTYLGYPNTTGLSTMDYRITDEAADPRGLTERFHVEELVRIPCAWCYLPPPDAPSVIDVRADQIRPVTFGSFNKLPKISSSALAVWSEILHAVPNSQLFLKASALRDPGVADSIRDRFSARGIHPARIRLEGFAESTHSHLARYGDVDIALDTFPYNGTTTTCEALYMGVPVITLQGESHVSRVGTSLLSCIGAGELIAMSKDDYTARATALARDPARRSHYHQNLRPMMQRSLLMDGAAFSRHIERCYVELLDKNSE